MPAATAARADHDGTPGEVGEDAVRAAVAAISEAALGAPILVMSDKLQEDDLPEHPCLRRTGLRSLIRDDVDQEFAHLGNLHRVVEIRTRLGGREKIGILLQPDPDPDGIACGYALRALLGRKSPTAPLISFGEIKRPENQAMVRALGIEVRTSTPEELDEFDGLVLVDVQPTVYPFQPFIQLGVFPGVAHAAQLVTIRLAAGPAADIEPQRLRCRHASASQPAGVRDLRRLPNSTAQRR